MLAVVVSRADSASEHIGEHLLAAGTWTEHVDSTRSDGDGGGTVYRTDGAECREIDSLHLETEDVGRIFGTVDDGPEREFDLLVFASRHAGETGALLTAHHTGNAGPAEFGGQDRSFARACPAAHSRVLDALREHAPETYEVGMECTHHGPTSVGLPSMFVELGSGEDQWTDPDGARAVSRAIFDLQDVAPDAPVETSTAGGSAAGPDARNESEDTGNRRQLVGFGGGHYAPRFERISRETDWAVGHVVADWGLDDLGDPAANRDVIRRVFAESAADYALVEGDADGVGTVVGDLGHRVVSETWVRETGGGDAGDPVPLWLADELEDALCPVDEGLRFGDLARGEPSLPDDVAIAAFPGDLLAEAQGIDAAAAHGAAERVTLAFETVENGTRAAGRAAMPSPADREVLVDDLVAILRERYDSVERTEDAVVAREQAFAPERAKTLGIPEGPKFGKLSNGQPVDVDGETIRPETVQVEREHRFSLGE